MAKWFGAIGFTETIEDPPGSDVWVPQVYERNYYGDVLRNIRKNRISSGVNDDIDISNQLSIISDTHAMEHMQEMTYITWMGARWKIVSVEIQFPRLILELGGVWNGPTPSVEG